MSDLDKTPRDDTDPGDAAYAAGSEGGGDETVAGAARADEAAASAPGERTEDCDADERQEQLLQEGLEETFPASDPVSVKRIT